MKWTVTIFDEEYEVEADQSYDAKRLASEEFIKLYELQTVPTKLIPACRVKRHEDRRVRYDFSEEDIPEAWKSEST